jgi:hypothetical protein
MAKTKTKTTEDVINQWFPKRCDESYIQERKEEKKPILKSYKLEDLNANDGDDCFVVAYETRNGRLFLRFDNYLDFYIKLYLETQNRFFHEILFSEKRKIYFDIDSHESPDEVQECMVQLIQATQDEILSLNFDFKKSEDVIVLSASDETKQSYHLILPHHICNRLVDLKLFTSNVVNRLEDKYRVMIDMGVYKKNQSFRMYGCMKRNAIQRVLAPYHNIHLHEKRSLSWDDEKWKKIVECRNFANSILSHFENPIKYTIKYEIPETEKSPTRVHYDNHWKIDVPDGLDFEKSFENEYSHILLYRNKNGYHCPSCDRDHIKENPYITISKFTNQPIFHCRRT